MIITCIGIKKICTFIQKWFLMLRFELEIEYGSDINLWLIIRKVKVILYISTNETFLLRIFKYDEIIAKSGCKKFILLCERCCNK